MVSAAGKKMPVFTSPVVVRAGRDAVPAAATICLSVLILAVSVPLDWKTKTPSSPPVVLIPEVPDTTPSSLLIIEDAIVFP
jgi:hypothetical protein